MMNPIYMYMYLGNVKTAGHRNKAGQTAVDHAYVRHVMYTPFARVTVTSRSHE